MNWKIFMMTGGLIWSAATAAPTLTTQQVKTFTLANGMRFLILESFAIPNTTMYTFWKAGSRNEVPGITGLSHFFEHMMFNGAKKYGPKEFDRTMEAKGGSNNAYTSSDVTVYQDWFPASSLETIFDLESDRIANLTIDPNMVESERGVVLSERSTGLENSNVRMLAEEVDGAAFRAHPYSWPVIGHESDIKAWTQEDLRRYFDIYYAPNNATVVIVGDVSFDEVKRLAEQYFSKLPRRDLPPAVRTIEPEQKGERRVFVRKESATSANVFAGYKIPPTNHADYYALEILQNILAEGKTSRLYHALVEGQLATEVSAENNPRFDPGLLYFYAVAATDVPGEKLEKAMMAEIEKLDAKESPSKNYKKQKIKK